MSESNTPLTELQFLLELLLNHKLTKETKALVTARIGHVEQSMRTLPSSVSQHNAVQNQINRPSVLVGGVQQAGSMAAKIQAMEEAKQNGSLVPDKEATQAPSTLAPAQAMAPQVNAVPPSQRIVGGEVVRQSSSGLSGTRGPRKF